MHGIESETDRITSFPHFPHLKRVARELKWPRVLSGVESPRAVINLQNKRL